MEKEPWCRRQGMQCMRRETTLPADSSEIGHRWHCALSVQVLTTPQGQKFVQAMTANAVEGYVQSARTPGFQLATKEAAMAGYLGTLEVSTLSVCQLNLNVNLHTANSHRCEVKSHVV